MQEARHIALAPTGVVKEISWSYCRLALVTEVSLEQDVRRFGGNWVSILRIAETQER